MSAQQSFQAATQGSLTVRFSTPADVQPVLGFYAANRHHNVDFRGDDIFRDRTEQGRTILVLMPDDSIGASSMSHPVATPLDNGGTGSSTEIGSTLARVDGFGLYPFLIASQIVHEFLDKTPDGVFFACIHDTNTAVTTLLNKKVGWNIITPTQDFADAVGEGANINTLNWLSATTDTLAHQARIVLAQIDQGYVENRKTGQRLSLDVSGFALATAYRTELTELANGAFGKALEQAPAQNLLQARAALKQHMAASPQPQP